MSETKPTGMTQGQLVLCLILFPILNALFWTFAGSFGWALGYLAGWGVAGELGAKIGSASGLGLSLGVILAAGSHVPVRVTAYVNLGLVCAGSVTLFGLIAWLLTGQMWAIAVGYLLGYVIAPYTVAMRQYIPSPQLEWRFLVGMIAAAVIGVVGWQVGGIAGWTVGGAIGLMLMRVLGECFRKQPIVILDKDKQPIAELGTGDRWRIVARQSVRWMVRGALAGLAASALGLWFVTESQTWQESALKLGRHLMPGGRPDLQTVLEISLLPMALAVITIGRLMTVSKRGSKSTDRVN